MKIENVSDDIVAGFIIIVIVFSFSLLFVFPVVFSFVLHMFFHICIIYFVVIAVCLCTSLSKCVCVCVSELFLHYSIITLPTWVFCFQLHRFVPGCDGARFMVWSVTARPPNFAFATGILLFFSQFVLFLLFYCLLLSCRAL